ncbi:phosphatidate cytidylyltransferase [Chloropicon primus]|uniref:Phosphatidate cytidylyltransferase n=1 Tax=Chloropicon primus TaxID=1764295 RepID=A0A5B8MY82_9CHLO|nr:phosphatidate cytidylyltransferase [Chloropicon primus]UPR04704.1 phosphatidate cytidylyltransferase [Chloropicon primus]|eukprot:QDZ25507.1 phosphatidate cytidylyltransferase [Chloropicon primus]
MGLVGGRSQRRLRLESLARRRHSTSSTLRTCRSSSSDAVESVNELGGAETASASPPPIDSSSKEKKKKSSALVSRIVTALVLGSIAGYVILGGGTLYAIFIGFIVLQCSLEYIGLMTSKNLPKGVRAPPTLVRRTMSLISVGMVAAAQQGIRTGVFEAASFVLLSMLLVRRSMKKKPKKKKVKFSELTMLVFGLFYCGYLPTFWVRLRGVSAMHAVPPPELVAKFLSWVKVEWTVGLLATFMSAATVVAADTGAFIGGKLMGSRPLISISPNKTVEGAGWGFFASLSVALAFNYWFRFPGNVSMAFGFAVAVYAASVFGDLIESSMKRAAGKKDSGKLLPGHGGLLDRFDSYIFTGVLAYGLVYWYYYFMGTPLTQLIIAPPR